MTGAHSQYADSTPLVSVAQLKLCYLSSSAKHCIIAASVVMHCVGCVNPSGAAVGAVAHTTPFVHGVLKPPCRLSLPVHIILTFYLFPLCRPNDLDLPLTWQKTVQGNDTRQAKSDVGPERRENDEYPSLDGFIGDLFELVVRFSPVVQRVLRVQRSACCSFSLWLTCRLKPLALQERNTTDALIVCNR